MGLCDVEWLFSGIKNISFNYFIVDDVVCYLFVVVIIKVYDVDFECVMVDKV